MYNGGWTSNAGPNGTEQIQLLHHYTHSPTFSLTLTGQALNISGRGGEGWGGGKCTLGIFAHCSTHRPPTEMGQYSMEKSTEPFLRVVCELSNSRSNLIDLITKNTKFSRGGKSRL